MYERAALLIKPGMVVTAIVLLLTASGCARGTTTPGPTGQPAPALSPEETPTAGQATTAGGSSGIVEEMGLLQLVRAADLIVTGSVQQISSQWNADRSQIQTDVRVSVEKCVKGTSRPSEVTVRLPGGQVGDIVQDSSGNPDFQVGEEVLVFLQSGEEGTVRVVGGFQGKLLLSGQRVVERDVPLDSFLGQIGQIMRDAGISAGACGDY
jgi:hypothetical protein